MVFRKNFPLSNKADYVAAKLEPKFVGPCVVKEVLSPTQYRLQTLDGKDLGRWNVTHLKPAG